MSNATAAGVFVALAWWAAVTATKPMHWVMGSTKLNRGPLDFRTIQPFAKDWGTLLS